MKNQVKTAMLAGFALCGVTAWGQAIPVPTFGAITTYPSSGVNYVAGGFADLVPGAAFGQGGGWTVDSGTVDLISTVVQSPDGLQSVDMDGQSAGQISTTLTIPSAGTVTVDFFLAGNAGGPPVTKLLDVALGSSVQETTYTLIPNNYSGNMYWTTVSMVFPSQVAGQETLTFTSLDGPLGSPGDGDDWGALVGTVTASENAGVPDGGMTATLLGMGVAGLAWLRRRLVM